MTNNQLTYWKLQEEIRANKASEEQARQQLAEQQRANLAREAETTRSNKAQEQESFRSHSAQESLGYSNLLESTRAHQANEGIGYANVYESIRSNKQREAQNSANLVANTLQNFRLNKLERAKAATQARESRSRVFSNYASVVGVGATKATSLLRRLTGK